MKCTDRVITVVDDRFKQAMENSEQCVYIYMDDINKVCDRRFTSLLRHKSPKEWARVKENFPDAFVSKKSQTTLISAYRAAVEKLVASTVEVTWKTKGGREVPTITIVVPIEHDGHTMALHFIEEVQRR